MKIKVALLVRCRRQEALRTRRRLRWAAAFVLATLGTRFEPARAGTNQWTSLGPYGGTIKTLVIDPQNTSTLYAWSVGEALFKGTDGAASWKRIGPGSPLAIDPQNSNILYALNAGVVSRSMDGGGTWSGVNAGLPNPSFGLFLTFDPVNSNTVYAATSAGSLRLPSLLDSNCLAARATTPRQCERM